MAKQLSELRAFVRQYADMTNSTFVTDSEINSYINSSGAELYDLIIQHYGDDYFMSSTTFNTVADTDAYNLPEDFYKLRGVEAQIDGGDYVSLERFNWNERNRYNNTGGVLTTMNTPALRYRLRGSQVIFSPTPDAVIGIRLWYVPLFTELTVDSDELQDVNSWYEYVVVDAAIKCLRKEESDVSVLLAQKQMLEERIRRSAPNRDAERADSIQDVYNTYANIEDGWS